MALTFRVTRTKRESSTQSTRRPHTNDRLGECFPPGCFATSVTLQGRRSQPSSPPRIGVVAYAWGTQILCIGNVHAVSGVAEDTQATNRLKHTTSFSISSMYLQQRYSLTRRNERHNLFVVTSSNHHPPLSRRIL